MFVMWPRMWNKNALIESIAENRKGVITIKARPGAKVSVEQLRHEFWFGCAISNSHGQRENA